MEIPIRTSDLKEALRVRGVRVVGEDDEAVTLECIQCRTRWKVARERLVPPDDSNRFWWCPEGCNREL